VNFFSGKFAKQCEICQRQNKKAKTAVPELNYASIGQRVLKKIGIDLINNVHLF
jgi:hypothetical protein